LQIGVGHVILLPRDVRLAGGRMGGIKGSRGK
jgi:hypothetical protein